MSTGKKVFIIGPGFIGWNVLELLVAEGYTVTGLVRRQEHADGIHASGGSALLGDLNDSALITEQTLKHDVVIHTATADHLPSVQAVLEGIRRRADDGRSTIFIHTSGTSVLDDNAQGMHRSERVYYDDKPEDIDAVPDDAPHREIDLAIVRAQKELGSKAKLAIMIPPTIYGFNPSHKRLTIQLPTLTRFAIKHGFAPMVGSGLPVESNIHVLDLARAYVTLLHHTETTPSNNLLFNPYYFCEATGDAEPSWREIGRVIGDALVSAGLLKDAEPRAVPKELYGDLFGPATDAVVGLNSRSRAVRLRELGWRPREKGWKASYIEDEFPELMKEERGEFRGYAGPKQVK